MSGICYFEGRRAVATKAKEITDGRQVVVIYLTGYSVATTTSRASELASRAGGTN